MSSTGEFIQSVRERTNAGLDGLLDRTNPKMLYDPVRHVLRSEGKRVRALLVHCAAESFGGSTGLAHAGALSVEVFHCFTLVHDDIMDRSDERRGRPTVHAKWDEPTAILCGDFLQGLALQLLLEYPSDRIDTVLHRFTQTVRVLCEGQIRDMEFESRGDVLLDEYLEMIDQKTAELFRFSLALGGLAGTADRQDLDILGQIGHHLGLAFQIQDDLLDLTATDGRWGKPVGGDIVANKKTYLTVKARQMNPGGTGEGVSDLIENGRCTFADIPAVREYLDDIGVLEAARSAVIFHSSQARELLDRLPGGPGRAVLLELTGRMEQRIH